jgi:hypothetical protein
MRKIEASIAGLKDPNNALNLDYIPTPPSGFTLKGQYQGNEPEVFFLKKAWPNMNTIANPGPGNDTSNGYTGPDLVLNSNQTLVLFLMGGAATGNTGFNTNPRKPFLPGGASRKGPYLEHNAAYIVDTPTLNGRLAPTIIDPFETPYAYFCDRDLSGRTGAYPNVSFAVGSQTTYPVLRAGKYVKEGSFQIISAGRDKEFGSKTLPGTRNLPLTDPAGADDQAPFQDTHLGAAN